MEISRPKAGSINPHEDNNSFFFLFRMLPICRRETLIEKAKKDIPSFDTAKATAEVDKFLMDPEMLDLYIRFGKEVEKDPNFKVPEPPGEQEGLFSLRNIVILYLAFVVFSNGPDLLRGYIADQEVAGTWSATGIAFIDNWVEATSAEAVAQAMARAAKEATN